VLASDILPTAKLAALAAACWMVAGTEAGDAVTVLAPPYVAKPVRRPASSRLSTP
jgi:hypothetical protein